MGSGGANSIFKPVRIGQSVTKSMGLLGGSWLLPGGWGRVSITSKGHY